MTKYYGRVAWFQLQCIKYRIQTSETWFNLMAKLMPGRLKGEAESENKASATTEKRSMHKKAECEMRTEGSGKIGKSNVLAEKLEKFRIGRNKEVQGKSLLDENKPEGRTICVRAKKKAK